MSLYFAVLGDIHGSFKAAISRLTYLKNRYENLKFALQTGDTGFVFKPSKEYACALTSYEDSFGVPCLMPRVDDLDSAIEFSSSEKSFPLPVYAVFGNHEDFLFIHEAQLDSSLVESMKLKENFYFLGRFGQVTINSIRVCYLSHIEPPTQDFLFVPKSERLPSDLKYYYASEIKKFSGLVAPYPHVFVSHEGPYINGYGSKLVRLLIKQLKPKFSFHGHLHTFAMGQLVSKDTYTVFLRPLLNSAPEESSMVLKVTASDRLRVETWPDAGYLQV